MKFVTVAALATSFIAVASAHMALLDPPPRGGYDTDQYNGRVQAFLGYKDNKWKSVFPCGGFFKPSKKATKMRAGQIYNVRFASSFQPAKDRKRQPKRPSSKEREFKQPRHGGGTCEFSLSYDGGKTFGRIGRYTYSCPDAYDLWPVKIPDNAKECKEKGKCLFVWTWLATTLPQYYMNCADIELSSKLPKSKQVIPRKPVRIIKGLTKATAPGDGLYSPKKYREKSGPGPIRKEVEANRRGAYA